MVDAPRDALITGIGIVSCLGEGPDSHWQALNAAHPQADANTYAPYVVHRLAPIEFDKQIPKKGDQRQMEPWQRIGTYAAGLALDSAGVKGNTEVLARMDMIVAAGVGERDQTVDCAILTDMRGATDAEILLNERLMTDLRPTLFLAQLSNLLAGNISIVHGVVGSSRTFMGEEAAGIDAIRIAHSRISAGQSDIMLVGGANNAERFDMLLLYEFGGNILKDRYLPVWERGDNGGFAYGSMGVFLVIEAREHAEKRGAKPIARLTAVVSDRSNRKPGAATATLSKLWDKLKQRIAPGGCAVLSGATGAVPATAEERAFLAGHSNIAVRATGSYVGHAPEAQFPMNIALAAIALEHGSLFPPCDATGLEKPMSGELKQVVVTGVGHWRGEGLALVESAR